MSQADNLAAETRHFLTGHFNVRANRRAHFDDRIVQLAFHLVFKTRLAHLEHLGDVRFQLARLRIDDLKFFFDADGK